MKPDISYVAFGPDKSVKSDTRVISGVRTTKTFNDSWHAQSATLCHCTLAASASSWAKAVAMKAETTRRPLLPTCASALRMKWTRGVLKNRDSADSLHVKVSREDRRRCWDARNAGSSNCSSPARYASLSPTITSSGRSGAGSLLASGRSGGPLLQRQRPVGD
jgi:hypothetical protein